MLALHVGTPFAGIGHVFEQLPQCAGSLTVSTHDEPHIVAVPQFATHANVDPESEQSEPPEHIVPHAPQFVAVFTRVSQPVDVMLSQSPNPGWQSMVHAPPLHDALATLDRAVQSLAHAPQ